MRYELQSTDRVGHTLEVVALSMRKVVHRIDLPLRTSAVMRTLDDTVDDRVAEVHIVRSHIDLSTERHSALGEFARIHTMKEIQALLSRTITIRAIGTRGRGRTLLLGNLLSALLVDICMSRHDETLGKGVELWEVVRSVALLTPIEAEPVYVLTDSVYVLHILFDRVGIVKA